MRPFQGREVGSIPITRSKLCYSMPMIWVISYAVLLLILGTCAWITVKKVKNDPYNPYFLKHVIVGYGAMGGVFLIASLIFLFQL